MTVVTSTIDIASEANSVFAFVSDLRNETRWNADCRSVTKLDDGPVGLGARYRANWKGSPELIVECVAFDPPRSWTNTNGGPIAITSTFTVAPTAGGCTLTSSFAVKPSGMGRLFAPIFVRKMKGMIPQHLATIKKILETEAGVRV
jgi:hypothetical protein